MPSKANPKRGEVWSIDFDPAKGDEINKARPAVVVSEDSLGLLALKIVVPITGWQLQFLSRPWMIRLNQTQQNGLTKESAADAFQVKSVSNQRFSRKLGSLNDSQMEDIAAAITLCVGGA